MGKLKEADRIFNARYNDFSHLTQGWFLPQVTVQCGLIGRILLFKNLSIQASGAPEKRKESSPDP